MVYGNRLPYNIEREPEMKRIYIKEEVCIGCNLCGVYCQVAHSQSKDLIKAFKRESPQPLARLSVEVKDNVSFSVQCRHCQETPCVYACLTGALQRDPESGIVTVDEERCIGCWTCILACPFGVIRQDIERGRIAKCDFCPEHAVPVCVANCPNEALVYVEAPDGSPKIAEKVA
jgi:carbon-monoxide dehydrogenase iron sulfur subunit